MFRLINRKKGVSRSPEEWLKYANARFNEYNVLQPWEDAQKEEVEKQKEIGNKDKKEKQNEKKPSSTNATEKKSNSKSLAQEAASVENPACIESNDHQDCKEQNPSEKEPKKSFLNGINRNLATFTFSSLFMLSVNIE
ncbi:Schizosaccharomyces specific protein Mug95 [Schizosaccharomyces osmophilus]|uniref:Schizosaccharomyces specific protein Mug95 n=1 Tax=Schizosaccharomyces osmophilus TaxID=2545709 RepID=A0AAE9WEX6_9SCHI|nr:Schizosaccharomyces specific protein Mug95 [Schizosaccharomyces osmophilus]WBW73962.1 Schizosaccharomyces specific protein Mug95 [Schizosaccharomyces osmophilus]